MSPNLGRIQPLTSESVALECLKKRHMILFLALYNGSQVSIIALWATCFSFLFGFQTIRSLTIVVIFISQQIFHKLLDNSCILIKKFSLFIE